jgi:hypothetical protein
MEILVQTLAVRGLSLVFKDKGMRPIKLEPGQKTFVAGRRSGGNSLLSG